MHRFQSDVTIDPGWRPQRRSARLAAAPRAARHRGNTIVLVVGILVLLVIIATAYITRTHAGRVMAAATQRATLRDDNAQVIAESIAGEIAEALFVRPIDPADPALATGTADPNYPRLGLAPGALRYGVDPTDLVDNETGLPPADGIPDLPYNFAPYQVVPFTNWPDGNQDPLWPTGPGNPGPVLGPPNSALAAEGNPLGNPGFSDAPWLADIEPLRRVIDPNGIPNDGDEFPVLSHWRHMSNIARPNNGWRICRNIGDITDVTGFGGIVTDLGIPVEQQLAIRSDAFNTSSGLPSVPLSGMNFFDRWQNWLSPPAGVGSGYVNAYTSPARIPPNFLDLKDLDGDGVRHNFGDRPQDEFVGPSPGWPNGTPRWNVGLVLADADGDGFTDSFWFLAPTMIERGIRQIVAFRIIDNSGQVNANTATRFVRNDISFPLGSKTRGHTPADIALAGDGINATPPFPPPDDSWFVGFFDNQFNWEDYFPGLGGLPPDDPASPYGTSWVRWNPVRWNGNDGRSFLTEIGVDGNPSFPAAGPLNGAANRLDYWRWSGLRPFSATGGLTPFTLADEVELRMYHGNNYPWILSRFERAVNTNSSADAFLRSSTAREESSEYLDQLGSDPDGNPPFFGNRELLFDSRHRLTLFSGARNDLMPPWLRWRWDVPVDVAALGLSAIDNFLAQARTRLDLREPELGVGPPPVPGERTFAQRLAPTLLLALTDGFRDPVSGVHTGQSYFGDYNTSDTSPDSAFGRLRRLAAGWSANILAYRDFDPPGVNPAPLADAVPLPEVDGVLQDNTTRFLGLEHQPFLLEAFIGHVYASEPLPDPPPSPTDQQYTPLYGSPGNYVDRDHEQTTIVVVQLANPFDQPIDLSPYKLRVFGQVLDLAGTALILPPATESSPATAIFYAIDMSLGAIDDFRTKWMDFLDIQAGDHPAGALGTVFWNAGAVWSTDRGDYDDPPSGPTPGSSEQAIELVRVDNSLGVPHDVVIDRFDYDEDDPNHDEFRDAVAGLPLPPPSGPAEWSTQPEGSLKPGIRIGADDQWITWARVTRAWGYDFNYNAGNTNTHGIQPNERAPRYLFARQRTTVPATLYRGDQHLPDPDEYRGDSYLVGSPADTPWFTAAYQDAGGTARSRKPTFFNMNPVFDVAGNDIYPGFAEPPYGYGSYFYGVSYPTGLEPGAGIPDKGFYRYRYALQMLQKDGDFEQVGELLNVWLLGHELDFGSGTYDGTKETFAEFMIDGTLGGGGRTRVNRLQARQIIGDSQLDPSDPGYLLDPLHAVPALPAGLRVLDAFVCDDRGVNGIVNQDELRNANGFSGKMTPGLININTAPVEVMRGGPHMTRMVDEINSPAFNPYVRLPEAIVQYRERFNGIPLASPDYPLYGTGVPDGAEYDDRDDVADDLRPERGLASIGELMLLSKEANFTTPTPLEPNKNWQVDFAAQWTPPLGPPGAGAQSTRISTDVNDVFNPGSGIFEPDEVATDVEEQNLLFAGISNLITIRSDMFTVYFKVRSFRQNPVTGVWDATDPEYIVDDSRYVMLVDRSEVNSPTDKPKILYLEKLPK